MKINCQTISPAVAPLRRLRRPGRPAGSNDGFSLIELIIVVAIIAVIAAIVIPMIGDSTGAAEIAKNKRNAQTLASVFTSADAAGVSFADSGGDLDQTILNTITGGTVTEGIFAGEFFGLPGLEQKEIDGAKDYLEVSGTALVYNAEGL
uniref:Prepilin-type N-terminal cleavage/methylation domain-containing protein n=1 Tax=uncultured bacterium 12-5D TaxID=1497524 RepID=A0A059U0Z3_9BACT|nr:hypothetical protein 5d5 [uncultured bacterium 12-5D]